MTRSPQEPKEGGDRSEPTSSARRYVLAGVVLLAVLVLAGGLFAVLRGDGETTDAAEEEIPEVTFDADGAATSIPLPPPNFGPLIQLSEDSGPPGAEVTLQGVNFKAGRDFELVEIYWDRFEGKPLKVAPLGTRFSVRLTIPADAPVLIEGHNIVVVQKEKSGKVVIQTSTPFFVVTRR